MDIQTATGSFEPIASPPPTVVQFNGEVDVSGSDYLDREQVGEQTGVDIGELRLGPSTWSRGPQADRWQQLTQADDLSRPRLFDVLAGLPSLQFAGESADNGGPLLRFLAPTTTELDLVTIFQQSRARKKPDTGTLEIEARPDGTPVSVHVTLTSDDFDYAEVMPSGMAASPSVYDFTFTFDQVGMPVLLPDLAEPTRHFASRFGLWFDAPADLVADTTAKGYDQLRASASSPYLVVRASGQQVSAQEAQDQAKFLQDATGSVLADLEKSQGLTFDRFEAVTIGGQAGYLVSLRTPADAAEPVFHMDAVSVRDRTMYELQWHTRPGQELVDQFRFERLLETVRLGG